MYTNRKDISLAIAVWLAADDGYDRKFDPKVYSVTELLRPLRMIILSRRLAAKKEKSLVDIEDLVQQRLGHAVHKAAEVAWIDNRQQALNNLNIPEKIQNQIQLNPQQTELKLNSINIYIEQRTTKKIMGVKVSGMFDFVIDGGVEDVKTTKVYNWIHGSHDEEYMLQESMYRWLNPDIIKDDYCKIHFIFTDYRPLAALADKTYPQNRIETRRMKMLSIEETERFIRDKIDTLLTYENTDQDELPRCTREELWQQPSKWSWYKDSSKLTGRSSKNFDTYQEASLHSKGVGTIVERPAVVKRCLYCDAREACTQAAQLKDMNLLKA
jgi:hypothetical protein